MNHREQRPGHSATAPTSSASSSPHVHSTHGPSRYSAGTTVTNSRAMPMRSSVATPSRPLNGLRGI